MLYPLSGKSRTIGQLLTTFHLLFVALDPFTIESAWILQTAARILQTFEQADCRTAWLVTATADECRLFLGPLGQRDTDLRRPRPSGGEGVRPRTAARHCPLGMHGKVYDAAEGWHPLRVARRDRGPGQACQWLAPAIPGPRDPGAVRGLAGTGLRGSSNLSSDGPPFSSI